MSVLTAPAATTDTLAALAGGDGLAGSLNKLDDKVSALITTDITDITASYTEVNYIDGVTSAVQTQIDLKSPLASPNFTGTVSHDTIDAVTADTPITINNGTVNTPATYTPAGAATATLDVSNSNIHSITMPAGNITIAISNETAGQCFLVEITQDGTGSRTVTWFSTIKWANGSAPTLTTTASKRDTFGFRVTGTDTYDGFIVGQDL